MMRMRPLWRVRHLSMLWPPRGNDWFPLELGRGILLRLLLLLLLWLRLQVLGLLLLLLSLPLSWSDLR